MQTLFFLLWRVRVQPSFVSSNVVDFVAFFCVCAVCRDVLWLLGRLQSRYHGVGVLGLSSTVGRCALRQWLPLHRCRQNTCLASWSENCGRFGTLLLFLKNTEFSLSADWSFSFLNVPIWAYDSCAQGWKLVFWGGHGAGMILVRKILDF